MKKLIALMLVGVLSIGTMSIQADKKTTSESPYGLAPINDERVIEMLKESGRVSEDATYEEAMQVLQQIVAKKEKQFNEEGKLSERQTKIAGMKLDKAVNNNIFNGNGNKLGQTNRNLPSVVEESYNGEMVTDKVLALLIDFPDYKANDITAEDSDMFYENYEPSHYADMLFSPTGYEGPNGENLMSMKQYYEAQSGGSYTVVGSVSGWYTASKPAAYYGGNNDNDNDSNARALVFEALLAAAADPSVNLADFDNEDRYDLDGDGNLREPDGIVDHIMIFHASVGEEAGGGALGDDAIWSHRWNLGGGWPTPVPGTSTDIPYFDGMMSAYDYTIQPADAAAGVCAHEYGHDLGLPDEYDTAYSGKGEPVSYWSIMSSGSWVGTIAGTEPTGFSPWAKQFLQANMGGNWLTGSEISLEDLEAGNMSFMLDAASVKGTNNDVIRVNLPDKVTTIVAAASGENMYYSQSGNNMTTALYQSVDLTNATDATFAFKAYYDIEEDWDAAFVIVDNGTETVVIPGNITSENVLHGNLEGFGWAEGSQSITGASGGWVDAEFDLSAFAGQNIVVGIMYMTDAYEANPGLYVDDLTVTVDAEVVLSDDVEGTPAFVLDGFSVDTGKVSTPHYYLLEWRDHSGVDAGFDHIKRGDGIMKFEEGLLVWYADDFYDNNHTGTHPGNGYIGVVDADQDTLVWSDGNVASTRYQMHDATFSLSKADKMSFAYPDFALTDNKRKFNTEFDDSKSYVNPMIPDAGRNVPNYGLKIKVVGESKDMSTGQIVIGF